MKQTDKNRQKALINTKMKPGKAEKITLWKEQGTIKKTIIIIKHQTKSLPLKKITLTLRLERRKSHYQK